MLTQENKMEKLLTPLDVSKILGVSDRTLAAWRKKGINLKYLKIGKRLVRYERAEVDRFIEWNTVSSEK